ncbi:chemokine-like receptor 1 [Microcaecilia unicolor]|uniref:Chemokine-like receptor 1 n=1 Tax=Microcaecilia unicolor TaxID=1415580 RepID=A0A6P7YVF3_9AMPH|nr:chemokine-like receptor 1 [Microcaecilia unicolor]
MANMTILMENATYSPTFSATLLENVTYSPTISATLLENATFSIISKSSTTLQRFRRRGNKCGDFSSTEDSMRILSIVIYCIAFIFGVMGNSLVIWVTGFKMKKTVNTIWFLNLAIADFIFTFFLPLAITQAIMKHHWPFGKFMCKINGMFGSINLYASVFFLTVISIDRCVSVVFPVWSQNHRTPRLASIVVLTIWCLAILFSLPAPIFRDTYTPQKNFTSCFNNYALDIDRRHPQVAALRATRHKAITIIRFIFSFCVPFFIIVTCYGIIALILQKSRLAARSRKPFRIITAVIVSFFLCWFPYHVFNFLELSLRRDSSCEVQWVVKIGIPIASSLAFLNSCVNPILYVFMSHDAQTSILKSFFSTFENAFKELPSQVTYTSQNLSKTVSEAETLHLSVHKQMPSQSDASFV